MPDYTVTYTLESVDGGETTKTFKGEFLDNATATAAAAALLTDLQAATHAHVKAQKLTEVSIIAGAAPGAKSVFLRASATVQLLDKLDKGNFSLPAPNDTINPSGSVFVPTATAWTDLMANFANGGWTISDGDHITDTDDGHVGYYASGETNF